MAKKKLGYLILYLGAVSPRTIESIGLPLSDEIRNYFKGAMAI
jgi:hypothetical protein